MPTVDVVLEQFTVVVSLPVMLIVPLEPAVPPEQDPVRLKLVPLVVCGEV